MARAMRDKPVGASEEMVTVSMTKSQAEAVASVLTATRGDRLLSRRRKSDEVLTTLAEVGIQPSEDDIEGVVTFKGKGNQ